MQESDKVCSGLLSLWRSAEVFKGLQGLLRSAEVCRDLLMSEWVCSGLLGSVEVC